MSAVNPIRLYLPSHAITSAPITDPIPENAMSRLYKPTSWWKTPRAKSGRNVIIENAWKVILAATMTFLAFSMMTFLPLFARGVFHQDVGLYSRLMAFSGIGSVIGALVIAWLGKYKRMGLTALITQAI